MRSLLRSGFKANSLLVRLLLSFFAVIAILVALNVLSFIYLKDNIHQEIVKYNELNMQHTMEGYERHIDLTKNLILGLFQNSELTANLNILRSIPEVRGYDRLVTVQTEIRTLQSNPFLHFENVFIYFKNGGYVLEKEGTSSARDMFLKFYVSADYPLPFWEARFDDNEFFHVYPSAAFAESYMNTTKPLGTLLPVVVKNLLYKDMYFTVMINADQLFRSLHYAQEHPFFIVDDQGTVIYTSAPSSEPLPVSMFQDKSGKFVLNHHYYFYKSGAQTGFTYVTMVPIQNISSQMLRLNFILFALLGVTVVIGTTASLLFSIRLHNPVKRIIESIHQFNIKQVPNTGIREFEFIGEKMKQLMDINEHINRDLTEKNSLLRTFAYTNKLKQIYTKLHDSKETAWDKKPFFLMLVHVQFLPDAAHSGLQPERTTYFIREYIDYHISRHDADSVTFQLDKDQILAIVFDVENDEVESSFADLKQVLDQDRNVAIFTIAVTPVFHDSYDFTRAYELAFSMVRSRPLSDETEIIRTAQDEEEYRLTTAQERELQTRFHTGKPGSVSEWIRKQIKGLTERRASVHTFRSLARQVAELGVRTLDSLGITASSVLSRQLLQESIDNCYTYRQFIDFFDRFVMDMVDLVNSKLEEQDPIIQFVQSYMEEHLADDLSLDGLADKLNISRGYLSTYIKEKMGINFSEYLNQLRIQKAKEMLGEIDIKIHDIATSLGYQNVNSFIRMFKRYSGVTPGEYRKKLLSNPKSYFSHPFGASGVEK